MSQTYNIFTLGLDQNMNKPFDLLSFHTEPQTESVGAIAMVAPSSVPAGTITSGELPQTIFYGKKTFSDTTNGFRQGFDPTDGLYKMIYGNGTSSIDWNVTTASTLTIKGAVSASTIDIGGADATSFHVDVDGNMWLGAATYAASTARISNAGSILMNSGIIGGWTLGATTFTGGNATIDSAGDLTLGTGNNLVRLSATDATYRLWAGHATASAAPFSVTQTGILRATNVQEIVLTVADTGNVIALTVTQSDTTNNPVATSITQNGTGDILNIFDGASEVFTILDGGNVGIVQAAPSSRFHVTVGTTIATGVKFASSDWVAGTTGSALSIKLSAATGNSTVLLDSLNSGGSIYGNLCIFSEGGGGLVGIGTASPAYPLDIVGTSSLRLSESATDAANKLGRILGRHYTNAEESILAIDIRSLIATSEINYGGGSSLFNAATGHVFYTAANTTTLTGTARMIIDSSGEVGIGITPTDNLHVVSTNNIKGITISGSVDNPALNFDGSGTGARNWYIASTAGTSGWGQGSLVFIDQTAVSARMTINSSGVITLFSDLAITEGGTGASTAANARTNLGVNTAWVQLGETVLGGAATTITVSGLSARKDLRIVVQLNNNSAANAVYLRFNNDSGNNYAYGTTENTFVTPNNSSQAQMILMGSATIITLNFVLDVLNEASRQKNVLGYGYRAGAASAGAGVAISTAGHWNNTVDQITRVDIISSNANTFAAGSRVTVYGSVD